VYKTEKQNLGIWIETENSVAALADEEKKQLSPQSKSRMSI
jgi:hypothetical protein